MKARSIAVTIDDLPRHNVLHIRMELMLRAIRDIQREIAELDLDGAPPAMRRRGLRVVDGGAARPWRR
jgi:hypothetical protein